MNAQAIEIRRGIVMFKGQMSRNLLLWPMASHAYFLEDGDEVTLFDPSCGKRIAKRVEAHIRHRRAARPQWKRASLIAGHSHMDHANNFYLSDVLDAPETHVFVHEKGFQDGRVKNDPVAFIEEMAIEFGRYYDPYRSFALPYGVLMYPLMALDALSPVWARKAFAAIGGFPWPVPQNGSAVPEPLRDCDAHMIHMGGYELRGWQVGRKVVLPTPGHSPCSVSLLWPEKKALFVSDADWIGNPVFPSASLKESVASLQGMKALVEAGNVELLLPGHGQVKEGREPILIHLDFRVRFMEEMKGEILATFRSYGNERDVRRLAGILVRESPLFRMLKVGSYPRMVAFMHNMVAVCLREEGLL